MKRVLFFEIIALAALVFLLLFLLRGTATREVALSEVEEQITANFSMDGMEKVSDMRLKRSFGLNPADYAEVIYYAPNNTMSVNEFFLVKVSDEQKDQVHSAIEERIATQKVNFDGYGTDQTDLLNHAVILQDGPYMGLLIGENAQAMAEICKKVWEE